MHDRATVYVVSLPAAFHPEPASPPRRSIFGQCTWRLVVAMVVVSTFNLGYGTLTGYLSPALPDLNAHRNPFHLTDDQQSWCGSMMALGGTIAGPITGTASDFLGRKMAMMVGALFTVVGLTITAGSTDADVMYAGVFIMSFASVICVTASLLYTAEIAPAEVRGACMSITTLAYSVGILVAYAMGIVLPWNWLAIFLCAFFAFPNIVLAFLPESPRLFVLRGNRRAAIHGLQWYRGKYGNDDDDEIAAIEQSLREESTKSGWSGWTDLVTVSEQRMSLFICVTLYILQGFSGVVVLQIFTVTIFQSAGSTIDPNLQTVIVGLCCVAGSLLCPLAVDRMGRKTLLVASAVTLIFSMAITAAFFQVLSTQPDYASRRLFWLPLLGLSLGNFGFMVGLMPVPYILTCEMFPTNTRANAQAITVLIQCLSSFGCIKSFFDIEAGLGIAGAFFIYTGICVTFLVFVLIFVRESGLKDIG